MVEKSNGRYINLFGRAENKPCEFMIEIDISPKDLLELMNSNESINEDLFVNYKNYLLKNACYSILGRSHTTFKSKSLNVDDILDDIKNMSNEEAYRFLDMILISK